MARGGTERVATKRREPIVDTDVARSATDADEPQRPRPYASIRRARDLDASSWRYDAELLQVPIRST
jgi:hypothetical protein